MYVSSQTAEASEYVRVADAGSLKEEGSRLHTEIQGRYISILRVRSQLFCIDSICYHAGGPLAVGDIEDLDGSACVKCPWHLYLISLDNGEKFYEEVKFVDGLLVNGGWKSSGRRQRTHMVEERSDGIFVQISTSGEVESDKFAHKSNFAKPFLDVDSPGRIKLHSEVKLT
mmetsp:Transcript_26504/g.36603  ORF Transcript_26504/g.36603 Transcript_26504/m.36603 type:complete len:171 (-) Transcript_26504:206-718(-)|eukprot:CAMPEP_0196575062 /NCGR_PEP_ID=MMETSP1081-20130531/4626_1 /TAXON_ID=36882 /ORGANISM="Pyramimonas amylifera, Strain CCMP720" /LENGTH=170 /DNA_ID=CAMNT_0041893251 /DNA_START=45 /DNA_END=557 /DNA_ORIENTATION=-